ncbi:sulfotransferase 1E1-like [Musca vetustissima]|uniref:sulfotransferase 1E1-like n=1 Tax=Musca vetustissima TaxID=27455 RepID=UPI002AB7AB1D|nr:sulfotransferase 1E1-like [Musca vetustissima]
MTHFVITPSVMKIITTLLIILKIFVVGINSTTISAVKYKPPSYPTNLLTKDWPEREIKYWGVSEEFLNKVHNLEIFEDDVWLVTLPKCGTTWMQELLWLVLNDFDFARATEEHLEIRSPFLEFDYLVNEDLESAFKPIENLKRPRLIKTHLCLPLLPRQLWEKKAKIVYVARNLKDALVSDYYHMRNIDFVQNQTLENFVREEIENGDSDMQFLHLTEFYSLRNGSWIFYTSFERMKRDLRQVILDVCRFLNRTIDNETMVRMLKHLSFDEMKMNPKTNHLWEYEQIRNKFGMESGKPEFNFIRKGKVNAYKEELSKDMVQKLDNWMEDNLRKFNITLNELLLLNNVTNVVTK